MLKFFIYSFFIFQLSLGCGSAQQQFTSHTVQKGETVYSIAKRFGTTEAEIYRLNPDARKGLKVNSLLILPANANADEPSEAFKEHRVKRRETIFGIAQLYNISVEEIKKHNKELYSRGLRNGEKLRIPITSEKNEVESAVGNLLPGTERYTVKPKETKFGLARKYGITIAELEDLNPDLGESLNVGTVLIVPTTTVAESAVIEEDFYEFYEVKAKEGFFRLKVKLGLSEEEIIALNPYAKNGLKEGMILKIPKKDDGIANEKISELKLEREITNKKAKNIMVMLPFDVQRQRDSTQTEESLIMQDPTLRVALDFYSGLLMAAEFAKDHGISVNLEILDTEKSEAKVGAIIAGENFKNVDAVIGPLLQKNVEKAAALLERSNTPVFSPLSNRKMSMSDNLFQTLPSQSALTQVLLSYLSEHAEGKNIVLITDGKKEVGRQALSAAFPAMKTVTARSGGFVQRDDIVAAAQEGTENWFVLESENPVLVSSVVGVLNSLVNSHRARLFTFNKNEAYDYQEVSNLKLARLQFTFPSVNKSNGNAEREPFLISYKNKYGVLPNRYAVRGFDVTYDVLLRLAATDDDLYDAIFPENETVYIENKFRYTESPDGGYVNTAAYLLKYNEQLEFEVVK